MSIITENEREYLLNSMVKLLDKYEYSYTDHALNKIINKWEANKTPLIEAFKRHPSYQDGNFMIAFNADIERVNDPKEVMYFRDYIDNLAYHYKDAIPAELLKRKLPHNFLPHDVYDMIFADLLCYCERTLSEDLTNRINETLPNVHAHAGEKTSRVTNRIFTYLGYNKHEEYNRRYAKYADALSPVTIKRHTVLSINPLDYLTMSFGNSWASCHTIDKKNKRNMPNAYSGAYSSGTISYMLDPSSMVFYTVDSAYNGTIYWDQPKINRQMFHWGEDKLVQSRLYPQDNDGDHSASKPYREIVQGIMSTIFDFPNLWTVSKGAEAASRYIDSDGTHYRDYCNFDTCTLSRIKDRENEHWIYVGHDPICIECGYEHHEQESINCCNSNAYICEDCGCEIDADDVVAIDGHYYCRECCNWCAQCEEYHRGNETYIEEIDDYVCEGCLEWYYTWCEDCGQYHHNHNVRHVDSVERWVCDDCLDENYTRCAECGEYFPDEVMEETDDETYMCPTCYDKLKKENEDNEENA